MICSMIILISLTFNSFKCLAVIKLYMLLFTDGKTYSNECTLQQKSCDSPKSIKVAYKGSCGTVEIRSEQGELI